MKARKTLLIILAVVVALLILFLIFRGILESTLGAKMAEASALFTKGTGGQPGIAQELQERLKAADGLQNIAARYDAVYDEYSALRSTHNELRELLNSGSPDLGRMYDLNRDLGVRFIACREALEPITEGKAHNALGDYQAAMDEAQKVIDVSGYNNAIRE
ncbi:MAG: hypothetical protein IKG89_06535, partial [Oscillospiraceae bacterium]|nr:hypothetical protein [Oscillospiraceae bacterium]